MGDLAAITDECSGSRTFPHDNFLMFEGEGKDPHSPPTRPFARAPATAPNPLTPRPNRPKRLRLVRMPDQKLDQPHRRVRRRRRAALIFLKGALAAADDPARFFLAQLQSLARCRTGAEYWSRSSR